MALIQLLGASRGGEQAVLRSDWMDAACRSGRRSSVAAVPDGSGKVAVLESGKAMDRSTGGRNQHLVQNLRQKPLMNVQTRVIAQ